MDFALCNYDSFKEGKDVQSCKSCPSQQTSWWSKLPNFTFLQLTTSSSFCTKTSKARHSAADMFFHKLDPSVRHLPQKCWKKPKCQDYRLTMTLLECHSINAKYHCLTKYKIVLMIIPRHWWWWLKWWTWCPECYEFKANKVFGTFLNHPRINQMV